MKKTIGIYELIVETCDRGYFPTLLKSGKLIFAGAVQSSPEKARDSLVIQYHRLTKDLPPGLLMQVEPEMIVEDPRNSLLYAGDSYDDLIQLLDVEVPKLDTLRVDTDGVIVRGNRRRRAAMIINKQKEEGDPKFPTLPVEIVEYQTLQEKVDDLVVGNLQRPSKSAKTKLLEAKIMMRAIEERSRRNKLAGSKLEDKTYLESVEEIAASTGFGNRTTLVGSFKVDEVINECRQSSPELYEAWNKIRSDRRPQVAIDIMKVAPERRLEVCNQLLKPENKTSSVKRIVQTLGTTPLAPKETQEETQAKVEVAKKPGVAFQLASQMFGRISVQVGGKKGEGADVWIQEPGEASGDWIGTVVAYAFGEGFRSIFKELDRQIQEKNTDEGIILCNAIAIHNKVVSEIIERHNMVVLTYSGEDKNIVYYGDRPEAFTSLFGKLGNVWFQARKVISSRLSLSVDWENDKTEFLGHTLAVVQTADSLWEAYLGGEKVNDCLPDNLSAKASAIAAAIMKPTFFGE